MEYEKAIYHEKILKCLFEFSDILNLSYSFKFNEPSLKVVDDLKSLLQEEAYKIEKLVA